MGDFVYNVAKGRAAQLAQRAIDGTGGAKLRMLVLEASAADATAKDYDDIAAVLGDAGTTEWTSPQYSRQDVTANVARNLDDANDEMQVDVTVDITPAAAATGNATTDVIFYYDPDGTDTDSQNVPLTQHDFVRTPDGNDIVVQIPANGFYAAT